MKARHGLLSLMLLLPLVTTGAVTPPPYKEPMRERVRSIQPVVYARVADHDYGVQYYRVSRNGYGIAGLAGAVAGGFLGGLAGNAIDVMANSGPTDLSEEDAQRLAGLLDREAAQLELESALATELANSPLFATLPVVKALEPGRIARATTFGEDPALVVDLYASLITDYRGLQVTAIVQELSAAEFAAAPSAGQDGRIYRNRFDYVSDLLPAPPVKTEEQIKADVKAVEEKYRGKLTKEQRAQRQRELRDAKSGTTLEKWREPLMEQWLASGGARLQEALTLGTRKIAALLAKDLLDVAPVEVRNVDAIGWRTLRDVETGRYTSLFVGGPFTGGLFSEPSGLMVEYCQGITFASQPVPASLPRLCP